MMGRKQVRIDLLSPALLQWQLEGKGAAAQKDNGNLNGDPEGGIFPATALTGKGEAVASMHKCCAQKRRDERQSGDPGGCACDQGEATGQLGKDDEIGKQGGKAEAFEKADSAGNGENKHLGQAMGEEQGTRGDPQDKGGEGAVWLSIMVRLFHKSCRAE